MNRTLSLTAETQIREPHLLSYKLKPYEKLPFSPSLVPREAQPPQSTPLGPTGLSSHDLAWNRFPQGKLPCSPPRQLGKGCCRAGMWLQGFGVDVFLLLFKAQDKSISSCPFSTVLSILSQVKLCSERGVPLWQRPREINIEEGKF